MKKSSFLNFVISPNFAFCFLLLTYLLVMLNPNLGFDEILWNYIGWLWNGKEIPPYIGAVENKTPGIFVLYYISDFLTGGNFYFTRIVGLLVTIISTFFLYKICKTIHSKAAGIFCIYIFGLSMSWYLFDGFSFSQTETFMIFFSITSFYVLFKVLKHEASIKWMFVVGILAGLAVLFKQIALTIIPVLFFSFFMVSHKKKSKQYKLKGVLYLVIGFSLINSFSYLFLWFCGVPPIEYFNGAWLILLNSGSRVNNIEDHFANFFNFFFSTRFVIFYPFFILLLINKVLLKNVYFLIIFLWLIFDFIGANASGYYYGHQMKQILPALSIIISILLTDFLVNRDSKINHENFIRINSAIIFLFFPYEQIVYNLKINFLEGNERIDILKDIGDFIKNNLKEEDYVYAIGENDFVYQSLMFSKRQSSSKYFTPIFIVGDYEREKVYNDLILNTPKFIIKDNISSGAFLKKYGQKTKDFFYKNYSQFYENKDLRIFKNNSF